MCGFDLKAHSKYYTIIDMSYFKRGEYPTKRREGCNVNEVM